MMSRREAYYAQRIKAREWVHQLKADPAAATGKPWAIWRLEELHDAMQARCPLPLVNRWSLGVVLAQEGFGKVLHGNGINVKDGQFRLWLIGKVPEEALVDGGAAGRYYDEERSA